MYGAISVKPTRLLLTDHHAEHLSVFCDRSHPRKVLAGLKKTGGIHTTAAAKYPTMLNLSLAN
eukprot:6259776-Karenia_brevis.AAC.1